MPNLQTRMLSKIDTLENWTSNNPILLNKEFGYIVNQDTKQIQLKIGDGITNFNNLPIYEFASQPKQCGVIGSATGTSAVNFENIYDELYVKIIYNTSYTSQFYLIKNCLSSTKKYYVEGWYTSYFNSGKVRIMATNTSIQIAEATLNGSNVADNCTIIVYGK